MNHIIKRYTDYCRKECYMGKGFYSKCWRLQFNEPCLKMKNYIREKENEFYFNKQNKLVNLNRQNNKTKKLELCGEDTFDHKGTDITNIEFLENEIFFEVRE